MKKEQDLEFQKSSSSLHREDSKASKKQKDGKAPAFASAKQQSSISVFYEQIVQEYQRTELADMAHLDAIDGDSKNKKKQKKAKGGAMNAAVASTEKIRTWTEHTIEISELEKQLETKIKYNPEDKDYAGLSQQHAAELLKKWGPNQLTEKQGLPWYLNFLLRMTGLFNYLLWAGSILCFIGYGIQDDHSDKSNLYLAFVLIFVIVVTAIFSYYQSSKSEALMAQFKNFIPPKANVYRDGKTMQINAAELVPGDLVKVQVGDNIPADLVLISTNEMKVNNASLTGESEELLRQPEEKAKNIFESPNVGFFGTACTNGQGVGIVFKTGDNTVIGQIANLAQSAESEDTPLHKEIDRFIKLISAIAVSLGLLFFGLGFIYGYTVLTNLIYMIGIIVANVPEGLLVTVTVCLALTAKRMAERMVLVKNLEAVETLGSTSCICSDKTGTLTQNKMTVSHIYFDFQMLDASVNYQDHLDGQAPNIEYNVKDPGFRDLVAAMAIGTKATFNYQPTMDELKAFIAAKHKKPAKSMDHVVLTEQEKEEAMTALHNAENKKNLQERKTVGDASESGLIKFVQPIMDLESTRNKYPVFSFMQEDKLIDALVPFSSEIKFNLFVRDQNIDVTNPRNKEDGLMVIMKGAPERILNRCSKILIKGEERDFDDKSREEVQAANDSFGKLGERVLAFARYQLEPEIYTKKPAYQFDVKGWKKWMNVKERDSTIPGWFPMHNLTLVGLVALNDPPRQRVDHSVQICKIAGIKVIMVTGDQPPTAAAIAHKVNIITDPTLEYNYLVKEKGMPPEEAWQMCKAVVVHGDLLAEKHANEDNLDDNDPEKGRFLLDWISKPEVVFARTTPSQKLLIVAACQKAGHIVAVTGDGVNDSPAIKKADIGIAMGSGSDVAKNAADMILLDDDFSSIVNGVEQGRVIFDNLKKSISYTLASNIPELTPFLLFIIIQIPLPLTTILILCVDIGTDMVPAVSYAYESPELDIMERAPRNAKRDHLVGAKLMMFAYIQIGIFESLTGQFVYFYVLNDYGFPPGALLLVIMENGFIPLSTDVYNPNEPNFGNSNFGKNDQKGPIIWDYRSSSRMDMRLFYVYRQKDNWSKCRWDYNDPDVPKFWVHSPITEQQICYTAEALHYAQGAYLISIVCAQWFDMILQKTRTLSFSQQQMTNNMSIIGLVSETLLIIFISYIKVLQEGLGTRGVACPHFAIPAFTISIAMYFYDEVRKIYVRIGTMRDSHGRVKYSGWLARNTLW